MTNEPQLQDLKNIGNTLLKKLHGVGIYTPKDLEQMGAPSAYVRMQSQKPDRHLPVCYYLYSLDAALRGVHWNDLTDQEKKRLKKAVDTITG